MAIKSFVVNKYFFSAVSARSLATEPIGLTNLKRGAGGRSSFNGTVATVFGATSKLGRHVVSLLGRTGTQIIIPYRGDPYKMRDYRVMGDLGQVLFIPFHLEDEESLRKAMKHSNVVINCIGKDIKTRNFTQHQVNVDGPARLARVSAELGVDHFIHVSALSANLKPERFVRNPSEFSRTKALGEIEVLRERPDATIFKPADMWGIEDNFLAYYACPTRRLNLGSQVMVPLWAQGKKTVKQPVHVADVAQGIVNCLAQPKSRGTVYDAVGPHRYRLDDLVKWIFFVCRYLPREVSTTTIFHPMFLAKVALNEYTAQLNPFLSFERLEREFSTDLLQGNPTLADLDVKLTKLEDRIQYLLYIYRADRNYWDAVGEYPEPPNPPLSPV